MTETNGATSSIRHWWQIAKWGVTAAAGIGVYLSSDIGKTVISNGVDAVITIDSYTNWISQGIKHTGLSITKQFIEGKLVPAEYAGPLLLAAAALGVGIYSYTHSGETGRQFHNHLWKAAAVAAVSTVAVSLLGPLAGVPAAMAFKLAASAATSSATYYGLGFAENTATRLWNWWNGPSRPDTPQRSSPPAARTPEAT